jgi:hypothetical protein
MADSAQTILTVGVPTFAVLIGILVNNSRLSDLRADLTRQIADTREILRGEMIRVEQVMDARLKHLEERS